jgi:hypothetical protein
MPAEEKWTHRPKFRLRATGRLPVEGIQINNRKHMLIRDISATYPGHIPVITRSVHHQILTRLAVQLEEVTKTTYRQLH